MLKCSNCKDAEPCVKYCDRKCQKKHYKDHKEDCRLCTVKLQADDRMNQYRKHMALSEKAQMRGDYEATVKTAVEGAVWAQDALEKYAQLGPRSLGIQIELCSMIALAGIRVRRFDDCAQFLKRCFAAKDAALAEDVTEYVYWTGIGTKICGEQDMDGHDAVGEKIDPDLVAIVGKTRYTFTSSKSWEAMIRACVGFAWTAKNQVDFHMARAGLKNPECGICCEPITDAAMTNTVDDRRGPLPTIEILPCRHAAHVKCLPAGYERSPLPGYVAPGSPTDIGICEMCVRTGQVENTYVQGGDFTQSRDFQKREAKGDKLFKRVKKLFGTDFPDDLRDIEAAAEAAAERVRSLPEDEQEAAMKAMDEWVEFVRTNGTKQQHEFETAPEKYGVSPV